MTNFLDGQRYLSELRAKLILKLVGNRKKTGNAGISRHENDIHRPN